MPKSKCQNCHKTFKHDDDLNQIKDLYQRVAPGEPFPSGECPSCGCLCQPISDLEHENNELAEVNIFEAQQARKLLTLLVDINDDIKEVVGDKKEDDPLSEETRKELDAAILGYKS